MAKPVLIKKYGNRRLYDTDESRYLTLEELALKIQSGVDVSVVEVKTGEDLTQATLTQIVIESRGAAKFLPVPLLTQMIRLGDDALSEFLGQYMSMTMELYLRSVRGMQMISPFSSSGLLSSSGLPNQMRDAFARFFPSPFGGPWGGAGASAHSPYVDPEETPPPGPVSSDDLAELRKEIAELKASVSKKKRKPRSKSKS
jgi:polyhydroxyalkanoate synthesis repressor PhaR